MADRTNPFTEADLQAWKRAIESSNTAIEIAQRGIRAGMPLQSELQRAQADKKRLEGLIGEFFPGR